MPSSVNRFDRMFLRYPGSKAKIWKHIVHACPVFVSEPLFIRQLECYCEPFFGSGAIGWRIIKELPSRNCKVVINDMDVGVASLWQSIRDCPDELIEMVRCFTPSKEAFYDFKARDGDTSIDVVRRGFEKLALHQTSFSGLGYMAGGPLGGKTGRGRKGDSKHTVDCRWFPGRISRAIMSCHKDMRRMKSFDVRNQDFAAVLSGLPHRSFVYLDPPYYLQGKVLYRHSMTDDDHVRLAGILRAASYQWVLSYDDCDFIRDLYSWSPMMSFEMVPSTQTSVDAKRRKNSELLIGNCLDTKRTAK